MRRTRRSAIPTVARGIVFALVIGGFAGSVLAAAPVVTSVSPTLQRIDAYATTPIVVTFDQPIDPATVTPITFKVFGRWSGPAAGNVGVDGSTITFTPTEPFFRGEWVTVNLSKGIKNMSAVGMVKGYAWNFWIWTQHGTLDMTYTGRISIRQNGEGQVTPYGGYAGDLNNDGWTDLSIPCETPSDVRVMMNDAGTFSTFTPEALVNGNTPSPSEGADFDNDGEIDMVVANIGNDKISILFGDGTGDYPNGRKTSYTAGSSVRGVGVLDLNGDGWDDIVTANRFANNMSIFINNGNGTFAPAVYKESGGNQEYSIGIADANHDGLLDVFCGSFVSPYAMVILLSDGNGSLTAQPGVSSGGQPWQLAVGDYNGDGLVDVAVCNTNFNRMGVLFGNGSGGFLGPVQTFATGSFPLAIDAGDLDGDGDLELLVSDYGSGTWTLYENTGAGAFANPRTINASSAGSCAIFHDRDNDGDLDITGFDELDDWVYFYRNDPPPTPVTPEPVAPVALFQNHPNPFNPSTVIRFALADASPVELTIYDAAGAYVATVARGTYPAGASDVRWDGADAKGHRVGSGVYFYRLASGGQTLTRKMVLLK